MRTLGCCRCSGSDHRRRLRCGVRHRDADRAGGPGSQATFGQPLPMYSSTGAFEGVCVFGQGLFLAGSWSCFGPDGSPMPTLQTALAAITPASSPHFGGRIQPYGTQGPFFDQSLMVYAKVLGKQFVYVRLLVQLRIAQCSAW